MAEKSWCVQPNQLSIRMNYDLKSTISEAPTYVCFRKSRIHRYIHRFMDYIPHEHPQNIHKRRFSQGNARFHAEKT